MTNSDRFGRTSEEAREQQGRALAIAEQLGEIITAIEAGEVLLVREAGPRLVRRLAVSRDALNKIAQRDNDLAEELERRRRFNEGEATDADWAVDAERAAARAQRRAAVQATLVTSPDPADTAAPRDAEPGTRPPSKTWPGYPGARKSDRASTQRSPISRPRVRTARSPLPDGQPGLHKARAGLQSFVQVGFRRASAARYRWRPSDSQPRRRRG